MSEQALSLSNPNRRDWRRVLAGAGLLSVVAITAACGSNTEQAAGAPSGSVAVGDTSPGAEFALGAETERLEAAKTQGLAVAVAVSRYLLYEAPSVSEVNSEIAPWGIASSRGYYDTAKSGTGDNADGPDTVIYTDQPGIIRFAMFGYEGERGTQSMSAEFAYNPAELDLPNRTSDEMIPFLQQVEAGSALELRSVEATSLPDNSSAAITVDTDGSLTGTPGTLAVGLSGKGTKPATSESVQDALKIVQDNLNTLTANGR